MSSENKKFKSAHNTKGREMSKAPGLASLGCGFRDYYQIQSCPEQETWKYRKTRRHRSHSLSGNSSTTHFSRKPPHGEMIWFQLLELPSQRPDPSDPSGHGPVSAGSPSEGSSTSWGGNLQNRMLWSHGLGASGLLGEFMLSVK